MKTFSPTPEHIDHQWFVVDADNQVLGRLAAQIAHRLRGKHKPEFAPHMDNGDVIVVVNCEKIKVTGAKLEKKKYYHHSGYVGGLREITLDKLLAEKPADVLMHARPWYASQESSGSCHAEEAQGVCWPHASAYCPGPEASVLPVLTRPGVNHV